MHQTKAIEAIIAEHGPLPAAEIARRLPETPTHEELYEDLVELEAAFRAAVMPVRRREVPRWGLPVDRKVAPATVAQTLSALRPAADRFDETPKRNVHFAA